MTAQISSLEREYLKSSIAKLDFVNRKSSFCSNFPVGQNA